MRQIKSVPIPVREIPVRSIRPSPYQMRRVFDHEALGELAASIAQHGLLQPVTVRPLAGGQYQLIAGERRLRAVRLLGKPTITARVMQVSDDRAALLCMMENLQREELHFFEEAEGYASLVHVHGMTQEAIAEALGRNPSTVANKMRLLRLSSAVRDRIQRAHLTERHARALLRLRDEADQMAALSRVVEEELTVRATEQLVSQMLTPAEPRPVIRRVYSDWRLLANTIHAAVDKMQQSGMPVDYRTEDRGSAVEIRITLPKAR